VLSPADAGAGVLVRRKGVPIGFWIQETNGAGFLSADEIALRIATEMGDQIIAAVIREELATSAPAPVLPLMTIAICTKDRPDCMAVILHSLSSMVAAQPEGMSKLEIIVVDNAPTSDDTRDLVAQTPGVRYLREPCLGLNFARNRALREARGEILAFLDDDVIPDQHWLAGLATAWAANPDAAAFTGQVVPMELETEAQVVFEQRGGFRRGFDQIRYGCVLPNNRFYPAAAIFGAGANMAFRTAVVRDLGGFDEALDTGAPVPGGGDLDMFYRIIRAGHSLVYEPRFLVFHQHRRDMEALSRQYRRSWGLGFMCYLTKCLRHDPERRVQVVRLMIWWFTHHVVLLLRRFRKPAPGDFSFPRYMLLGELWGGLVGLLGGYARSRRRVEKIRQRCACSEL
jgi:glycosyltransferase involved in cell wall biosynthesis